MSDVATDGLGVDPLGATEAIAAAMAVLGEAEVVAAEGRADADRYARQRELEADMLLQKARRVLLAAEAKAAVIVATARAQTVDLGRDVLDLDALGHVVAAGATSLSEGAMPAGLDRMLESAIAHAVTDAFPTHATP